MVTTTQRLTYDDLVAIPQEREGDRLELIDGELIVTPAPIPYHQDIARNIAVMLTLHVQSQNLGKVYFSPLDVRLTPDFVLNPDIFFIARDRLHIIGPKTVDAAPDLVVEILSPRTRQRDLDVKRALYARFGVQEYWIVDPDEHTLIILRLRGDRFEPVPTAEDERPVSRQFPALEIDLADIFQ